MNWTLAQQRFYRHQVAEIASAMGQYDDDDRRAVLKRVTGRESTSEIDFDGMRRVINFQRKLLRECGIRGGRSGSPDAQPKPASLRKRCLARSQDEYIAALVEDLGWTQEPGRLRGFILRQTNGWNTDVSTLLPSQKSDLIVGLRAVLRSQWCGTAERDRAVCSRPNRRWTPRIVRAD